MEQGVLPEVFETSLCAFVDVTMALAGEQEAVALHCGTKPGAFAVCTPLPSSVGKVLS